MTWLDFQVVKRDVRTVGVAVGRVFPFVLGTFSQLTGVSAVPHPVPDGCSLGLKQSKESLCGHLGTKDIPNIES